MNEDKEKFIEKMRKMQDEIGEVIYKEIDPRVILSSLSYHIINICLYNTNSSAAIDNVTSAIREGYEIAIKLGKRNE